jgi:hypothetical protein
LPMRWPARASGSVRVQSTRSAVLGTSLVASEGGGRGCCGSFLAFDWGNRATGGVAFNAEMSSLDVRVSR